MRTTTASRTGHLAMFQTVTTVEPSPMASPTASGGRAGEHEADGDQRGQDDGDEGDQQHRWP